MSNRKVNSITYGAIICALVGAMLMVNRQLAGFLDLYLFWIIPLPIIVYCVKFDCRQAIIMSFAMLMVALVTTGFSIATMFYVVSSIIAGIVYGYGLTHGRSATFLIGSVIAVSLVVMVVSTFIFASFFGFDVSAEIKYMQDFLTSLMSRISMNDAQKEAVNQMFSLNTLMQIYVISSVLSSVLEGVLVHMLAYIVLRRLKLSLPPMKPVSDIYAPTWLKLFIFGAFFADIVSKFTSITQYDNIILPMIIIAEIVCFFFGYIFVLTLLSLRFGDRRKVSRIMFLIIVLFVITAPILVYIGVFDVFSNARRNLLERIKANANKTE